MSASGPSWEPKEIRRFLRGISSSAFTAVVETDAGQGYLKTMGGPEGDHTLACELIGTRLAAWLGLPTLDFCLIELKEHPPIPFYDKDGKQVGQGKPGPAFITRAESGGTWGGDAAQLKKLANPEDISRLVVFDTWTLNCDRFRPAPEGEPGKPRINRGNVFLSEEAPPGKFVLKAIDHGMCFTCGKTVTKRVVDIDMIKEPRVFGRFPEFAAFLDKNAIDQVMQQLRMVDKTWAASMMRDVPREWDVSRKAQDALVELIVARAGFVADTIKDKLWPQQDLEFGNTKSAEKPT